MKKFLALYLGTPDAMSAWREADTDGAKMKAGMEGWTKWAEEKKGSITDLGTPLGKTLSINKDGVSPTKNEVGAYTIVEAETQEDAAKLFVDHPHFMIFPGDRVEIMECLHIPGM